MPKKESLVGLARANWKAGLTVAFISIPLSIALSVASGAGPVPGVVTGIWATLIASLFGSNNYNIIGVAGALTSVLFAATLSAPSGLGAAVLPLLAIASGIIIFFVWFVRVDHFLYYIPSSVMYGFAAGVAFLIAASQLFDATGLSALKRTGTFAGDVALYVVHAHETSLVAVTVFAAFIVLILVWKRFVPKIPAVIPAALLGIVFGWVGESLLHLGIVSLGDKFGSFSGAVALPTTWNAFPLLGDPTLLMWLFQAASTIALISVLETLITAQIADKITKAQSSSRRELLGLALANIGSGVMGGLPATGVFIRTGANIKAGATHRTSAFLAAIFTAIISLLVMPFFSYIPMAVIAAILVNTAIGLIEVRKFFEFFEREKESFFIAIVVLLITVFRDAGTGVAVGAVFALLFFVDRVNHGYFDVIFNLPDGTSKEERQHKILSLPHTNLSFVTYSIAGFLGYIDANRHAANLRRLARAKNVPTVIIRLRNLFSIDYEGEEMVVEQVTNLLEHGKQVFITSANEQIRRRLLRFPQIARIDAEGRFCKKAGEAMHLIRTGESS